ncbi:hypothetical protein [Zavarzinia aquatilis]|uniref:Uncharacterized protein n=1 Tax=Zavarzinia aquatilis TaxID=2211142 RepID=A0A317EDM5_9PROT|nr:hypothetical protein [Zavarzinia aquatilis]PWR24366.1 hypothetical protein DKG74_09675 [Zavarzinia aquatilis]
MSVARLARILFVAVIAAGSAALLASVLPGGDRGTVAAAVIPPTGLEVLATRAVEPSVALAVDSRGGDETYPAWLWLPASADTTVGRIEEISVEGDVLALSGWAGDMSLGLRMSDVLLVACDRVIATVPVTQPRDDIAARHPNLTTAGWSARLALADLGPCRRPDVSAYGVARFGNVLFPIDGLVPAPAGAGGSLSPGVGLTRPAGAMRSPERSDAPVRVVTLEDGGIVLRRCGRDQCAVIGRLPGGRQRLVILDSQSGWQLVASGGGSAGWVQTSRLYGSN